MALEGILQLRSTPDCWNIRSKRLNGVSGGMTAGSRFSKALAEGFTNPAVRNQSKQFSAKSFRIGDGEAVLIGDKVVIPQSFGGSRADTVGEVISLFEDGLGLRFNEDVEGIKREFFAWTEIDGATIIASSKRRRSASIPPLPSSA